jgi:GNAT superfamily N-acetyltransferase
MSNVRRRNSRGASLQDRWRATRGSSIAAGDRESGCRSCHRPRPGSVLSETKSEEESREAQAAGRLFVALAGDTPVGFAQVELLGLEAARLKEIDVHPDHGRRGLGKRLVAAVCEWAVYSGYPKVTLTTFRDVPWDMPFYARLGFDVLPATALRVEVVTVVQD